MSSKNAGKLPEETRPAVGEKRTFSKTDSRYWKVANRLFKDHGSADYSARVSIKRKRHQVCFGSPNLVTSAKRASEFVARVQAEGWEAALAPYRPVLKKADVVKITVGRLIELATSVSAARPHTLEGYSSALRLIVSKIKGIAVEDRKKYDPYKGGAAKWRAEVDKVPLDSISPADVLAWRNKRIRNAEHDPLAKRRAITSTNSMIRNASALFGKKLLPFIEQIETLPRPLPFEGISLEKEPSQRYISKIDPFAILKKAKNELEILHPEQFKVLALALMCGLRRSEIDNLLWTAFNFAESTLNVESSEYHELKTEESAGKIDLGPETVALFKKYRAQRPKAEFVVESKLKPKQQGKFRRYRCAGVFSAVMKWLRQNGVETQKPLHTLRKEIGSVIASEHGIYAASSFLRHAGIQITSAFYVDKKQTIIPKALSGVLSEETPVAVDN